MTGFQMGFRSLQMDGELLWAAWRWPMLRTLQDVRH